MKHNEMKMYWYGSYIKSSLTMHELELHVVLLILLLYTFVIIYNSTSSNEYGCDCFRLACISRQL